MNGKGELTAEWAIDTYADMVYRLALSQMKNTVDADDIFQEVFIRSVKNISKLDSEEHLEAWLIRVTINCSKKHFSNFWNRNVDGIIDDNVTNEHGKECKEIQDILEGKGEVTKAVSDLPKKYRAVVYLFYYEELSIDEIAKILETKSSTIKSQLFRAREMLRKTLGEADYEI